MKDLYPSRVSTKPEIIERKDPVLHAGPGGNVHGPLSNDQLNTYEQKGFLFLDDFFSEEDIQAMKQELDVITEKNRRVDAEEIIREPESEEIRSIFDLHQNHAFFQKLVSHERLAPIIEQILGSEAYVMQSRVNFKPGFNGKEFNWHSDFETWHVEDGMPRMRAVSCSILLTDNNPYNGPLMLVPGSHKYFVSCVGETPDANYKSSLRKQEIGVPDNDSLTWLVDQGGIEAPTGKAGSVLLFECNTMHGSAGNITPWGRNNLFFVYNSVENKLQTPFGAMKPRPEFLANRHVDWVTTRGVRKQEPVLEKVNI